MKTVTKILVAIDFSDYSLEIVQYAASLARDFDAKLVFGNIYNQRDVDMMHRAPFRIPNFSAQKYIDENIKERKEQLEKFADTVDRNSLDVETIVRTGVPYDEILKIIKDKKPDLLVMGSKGRSNLSDIIVGSCAQKLFRRSPIPLLILRGEPSTDKALNE